MRLALLALLPLVAGCPTSSKGPVHQGHDAQLPDAAAATFADWHGRAIYFVVTDRFADGDPSNDDANGYTANRGDPKAWHGGDFQGLIDHLDYIAGMGFTGLWITPVIEQHDGHGYHGYWGWNWSTVDAHLGDMAKLHELVVKAHARGIAVMIDTVANHTGRYSYQSPTFPDYAMYHHNGDITNYNDQNQVENYDLSGLNDLAQEVPAVKQKLLEHVRWLLDGSGADGLRIDTAKHVPVAFWRDYVAAARVFTIGEVLDGRVDFVARYTQTLAATLDYPLFFPLRDVFSRGGSARQLGAVFAQDNLYSDAQLSGVFVDNHDQTRFLCDANGDLTKLQLALALAFTARGIPILYYGTEQGFASCTDNRQDMVFDPSAPLYAYVRQLNAIRAAHEALRTGVQRERWQDDTVYAFEREAGASAAVVAINIGAAARTLTLATGETPGTVLVDALGSGATVTIGADRTVLVQLPARSVVVLTN